MTPGAPTIRALMLAQQARHKPVDRFDVYNQPLRESWCSCNPMLVNWPCADRVAADAVIATLDAADWQYDKQRLVPDPEAS